MTVTTDRVVTIRRVLRAPPDLVYDEWLDPVGMTEWMCPRPARAVAISLEPSVGGAAADRHRGPRVLVPAVTADQLARTVT